MLDDYKVSTVSTAFQNLRNEEEKQKKTNEEIQKAFFNFVKNYESGNVFKYREQLRENKNKNIHLLEVDFLDLQSENKNITEIFLQKPAQIIPLFEQGIKEVIYDLCPEEFISKEEIPDFQFILNSQANPQNLRSLNSSTVQKLVIVSGIIISASKSSIKMKQCAVQCRSCGNIKIIEVQSGFGGLKIPRQCDSKAANSKDKCPLDSYKPLPEKSTYIDVQILKIQEAPELIPVGEIPRSYMLYAERNLVNKVSPGTRVTVVGIQCVDERTNDKNADKNSYIRVIQFQTESKKTGRQVFRFTKEEESNFINMAKDPKIYEKIAKSIAPAIYGSDDIKRAIACLLFGGCRKKMNGGVNLRGDINILLLGDPSTAKSQFLKFVERVAPVAVYTSGKGSSAAGLTASIIKDPSSGEFQLEGGAMVLADGGIVCIDEFDKMRTQDRVAIHEAMEQQTISVAKAGITTTLNSRTSVLAAANPIYGHIDDLKSTQEQIDFQTTILSRFDCIFVVRDVFDAKKDEKMAHHIVDISAAGRINDKKEEGEISTNDLKKYIAYARCNCTPKLTEESGNALQNHYVQDRKTYMENKSRKGNDIPVTVRQLEAIIRMSEAYSKMSLSSTVNKNHVEEAHRLFKVSTLNAAKARGTLNYEISEENMKDVIKIEEAIKRKLSIGQRILYSKLIDDLALRFSQKKLVGAAVVNMVKSGELKYSEEKKIIVRKK